MSAQGVDVLSCVSQGTLGFGKRSRFDLAIFSHELASLLRAGLTLTESLETLSEREGADGERQIIHKLLTRLQEGKPLSSALKEEASLFPPLYIASIASGERTGALPEALDRYRAYQYQLDKLRSTVISASVYPALLLIIGTGVALFLLMYLVPRFAVMYDSLESLPWGSQLLLRWGLFASEHALFVSLTFAGMAAVIAWALFNTNLTNRLVSIAASIGWLDARMRLLRMTRFYRAAGLLLVGGTPLVQTLQLCSGLLTADEQARLKAAENDIREGIKPSQSLQQSGLLTPVAFRMIRVGERNGELGVMLEKIAIFHDEELTRWIERMTRLIEPLLMLVIGGLIGTIVVLLYLPIFELAGQIS